MRAEDFIIYKKNNNFEILDKMCALNEYINDGAKGVVDPNILRAEIISGLYEYATENGFAGNLWYCYLTELLVYNENPYTKACELRGAVQGTVNEAVKEDLVLFMRMFRFDLKILGKREKLISNYEPSGKGAIKYNKFIVAEINKLANSLAEAKNLEDFKALLDAFYGKFGVGVYGLHKAFRVEHINSELVINPIFNIAVTSLDDLIGYEIPKKRLIDNTVAFLEGKKSNNCLLYGESGTGKSSSIRAILNQYYDRGLRMIEVYKHQYQELNELIDRLKTRNYKFIIYLDDLSFEEFETEYKYLKAVIEGGLESKPNNVLIYATSNRRHLVKESFSDKDNSDDVHRNETVQEKLSLFQRFGESIYFGSPEPKEFKEIVLALAKRYDIPMPEDELLLAANKWELSHGGLSGRTATQFIDAIRAKY